VNFEKVVFGFFIVLALTLNFGFFLGDIDNPEHHHAMELGAALAVSLIATIMKFGDRSQMGAVLLATSLVAATETGMTSETLASIVSLSGGALLANLVSVTLLVAETITIRR
jgi:hypothetical protein